MHKQQSIVQSHSPSQVALTNFNFSNPWGVHLQVDWKSVRFMDSDWLSTLPRVDSYAKHSVKPTFCVCSSYKLFFSEACVAEIMRLSCTAPVTVNHKALVDSEIAGYTIPKGTVVCGSVRHFPNWRNSVQIATLLIKNLILFRLTCTVSEWLKLWSQPPRVSQIKSQQRQGNFNF